MLNELTYLKTRVKNDPFTINEDKSLPTLYTFNVFVKFRVPFTPCSIMPALPYFYLIDYKNIYLKKLVAFFLLLGHLWSQVGYAKKLHGRMLIHRFLTSHNRVVRGGTGHFWHIWIFMLKLSFFSQNAEDGYTHLSHFLRKIVTSKNLVMI